MAGELVSRTLEIFHSGAWEDITPDGLNRDPWRIRRGVSNRGGSAGEGSLRLPLRNGVSRVNPAVSSRYARGNALSDLFGLLPPNTPIRVSAGLTNATPHIAATGGNLADTTVHVAPSLDAPTDDAVLLCAWAAPDPAGTYTLPGSMTASGSTTDARTSMDSASEAITASGATGTRTATFSASEDYLSASVLLHGTGVAVNSFGGFSTLLSSVSGVVDRWWVVVSYFGWDDFEGTILPGSPNDTDGGGWILLADSGTSFPEDLQADFFRLKVWAKRVRTAGPHTITLDNPGDGIDSIQSVFWEVSGAAEWSPRMVAETVALPPRADVSQNDLWTPVDSAGVLRRLGIPSSPIESPLQRATVQESGLVAYWPWEGLGERPSRIPSAVRGVPDMSLTAQADFPLPRIPLEFDGDARLVGSRSLPTLQTQEGEAGGNATVAYDADPDVWALSLWNRAYTPDEVGSVQLTTKLTVSTGEDVEWELSFTSFPPGDTTVPEGTESIRVARLVNGSLDTFTSRGLSTFRAPGEWRHAAVIVEQVATDVLAYLYVDGVLLNPGGDTLTNKTLGQPDRAAIAAFILQGIEQRGGKIAFGHPAILSGDTVTEIGDAIQRIHTAGRGHVGETAGRRVERLCAEQGVSFTSSGDLDASAPLGPQHPENFLDVLESAAKVEAGGSRAPVLTEQRTGSGLHFRTLASMSLPRTTPDLTLDYDAAHLSPPFDPTPDDFGLVNDATAKRRDGGEARIEVAAGPKGITTAGRYDAAQTFAALSDTHLDGIARHWTVHGTHDEDRYPTIRIDMRGLSTRTDGAALVAAVQALDPGALIRITNPPAWLPQQNIDQIVLGITETISTEQWLVDLHTTAAAPFTVAVLEHATVGLAQSDSATLDEPLDATETAVDIDAGAGPDWVHDGVNYDIVIRPPSAPSLSGERMTVTAVGAMTGTFPNRKVTLTVTRSVNGIVTTHATGAKVEWATKAYIGLWG